MSTPFSKNKEKRPRPSAETNKSFVRNVTSRMSGLLPATITKWFSSPSSSNTNGSAQAADATDSSTEDEALESPVTTQPPAKRMRYSPPGNFSQYVPVETKCTSTNTEPIDEPPNTVQSPMDRNNIRREKNFASTRLQTTNNESCYSTQNETFFKSQSVLTPIVRSMPKKRKSLFDNSSNESFHRPSQSSSGSTRDPYFKPSLLSSPFYVGRTMYGGAASSYMNQPNIKQRKINLTDETTNNDSVTISHSARRVMDLLEHYSSPLIEAKRIPPFQVTKQFESSSSKDSPQKHVNPYGPKNYSYKTQELYVPSVASILTIKRKSRLMDTTNAARQIIASHSSTSEFLPYPKTNSEQNSKTDESGDKLTTKVKSRLTRANRDRIVEVEMDPADKVKLPNVVLQIDKDNLPKFTFDSTQTAQLSKPLIPKPVAVTPDSTKVTAGNDISAVMKKIDNKVQVNKSTNEINTKEDIYKFSSPVQISSESPNSSSTPPKFNFGSPERNVEKVQENKDNEAPVGVKISSQNVTENKLPILKSSDWKCLDCWVLNKVDVKNCVCCGGKKPIDLEDTINKCSSCKMLPIESSSDKCSECAKKTNNIDKTFVGKITNSTKWKCNDCWVDNDESASKCVCCGGNNPKNNQLTSAGSTSEAKLESEWKCNDCWIKNKSTSDKCAACCAPKPGSKSSNIPMLPRSNVFSKVASDTKFESIAKSQREKWECPLCLVRNESDRTTCICCEADKPGTVKESQKNIFNFHQPSEVTFKFGIQPTNQEFLNKTQTIDTDEASMAEESETNNNVVSKAAPSFSFGLPMKKIVEKSENQVTKPEGVPKMNFTFGVPKDSEAPTIFGSSNKLPDLTKNTQEKEKPQEVPRVFTPPASEGLLKTSVSLFKPPVTSQNTQEISTTLPIQAPTTTKELSFFNAPVMTTATSELKMPQSSFTFSSIKPATNLFATTSTPAPTSITAPLTLSSAGTTSLSIFQKPDVTTTTVSFFQSSNSATTTTASVFPKAEATVTTPSVSLGGAQPVFSFGSSTPSLQPEKHKFQFSFGTNKTETPSLFKPTFGVSNDNNASKTNFSIQSNSITTGNGLSTNPLSNTTQVNPPNPLTTGNTLSASAPTLFGTSPKESMWPTNNNMFATNTSTNTVQKPPAFTFGASTQPFNANNTTFGTNTQPSQNVFGIPSTTSQPMFGAPMSNQTTAHIFGAPQNPNSMPTMGIFGSPNTGGTPAFGAPNPTMPFEAPAMAPAPTPTFNFGGQQPPGIFGFGQQQNQAPQQTDGQPQQTGLYSFGAPTGAPQQLQFNMGSAPQTGRRVIRKAMRRTQR